MASLNIEVRHYAQRWMIQARSSDTVTEFITKVATYWTRPVDNIILLYKGKPLKYGDSRTLAVIGIESYQPVVAGDKNAGGISAQARLLSDLNEMMHNPPEMISGAPKGEGDDLFKWQAIIYGPPDTPYYGGFFYLDIDFPSNYPYSPPSIKFKTRIYHPNVNSSGGICAKCTKTDGWNSEMTIAQVLTGIYMLMCVPNPEDPYRSDVANLYKNNRSQFNANARSETYTYARP